MSYAGTLASAKPAQFVVVVRVSARSIWSIYGKIVAASTVLALSGCAPNCPPPKIETQVVKEPVAVACVDQAIIPPEPGTVTLPIDARLAADLAASQAKDLRAWGRKLVAIIKPCTETPQ